MLKDLEICACVCVFNLESVNSLLPPVYHNDIIPALYLLNLFATVSFSKSFIPDDFFFIGVFDLNKVHHSVYMFQIPAMGYCRFTKYAQSADRRELSKVPILKPEVDQNITRYMFHRLPENRPF